MRVAAAIASALSLVSTLLSMAGLAPPAAAADIALTASNAINAALDELVPPFERDSGHKVAMRLGVASVLRKEIEGGAAFDVAILVGNLDGLVKHDRPAQGERQASRSTTSALEPG